MPWQNINEYRNMESLHFKFKQYSKQTILDNTSLREGELKIGQEIAECSLKDAQFVLLGISEDFGPQANGGNPGSTTAFAAFLPKFCSIQSNDFLNGKKIHCLGEIKCKGNQKKDNHLLVEELDSIVEEVLNLFVNKNQIPIVIGGGHNNALPLMRFVNNRKASKAVVNCDPHADLRSTTHRHSGNSFSKALEEETIHKYAVIGLHQSYNNQYIISELTKWSCHYTWFDDLIQNDISLSQTFSFVKDYLGDQTFGLELDMDAISGIPSSAKTLSGITIEEARKYVMYFAKTKKVSYLHLPEAAPQTAQEKADVGKVLAYLVSDFIKAMR
jgi:formiminoglutamase